MGSSPRLWVAPAYLLLCLVAGGSAQAVWGNMLLQLLGLGIIGWAIWEQRRERLVRSARQILWLVGITAGGCAASLVPLPFAVWSRLGGRQAIAEGLQFSGWACPAFPLSLMPYKTIGTLLYVIPPLAMFLAIVRLKAYRGVQLALALLAGTIASILLGTLQMSSTQGGLNPWNLYADTNYHVAVGFFANADRMATCW